MSDSFYTMIPKQSDDEVREYIVNRIHYVPEAVEAAISELAKRGRGLSADEIALIRKDLVAIEKQREETLEDKSDVSPVERTAIVHTMLEGKKRCIAMPIIAGANIVVFLLMVLSGANILGVCLSNRCS